MRNDTDVFVRAETQRRKGDMEGGRIACREVLRGFTQSHGDTEGHGDFWGRIYRMALL